MGRLGLSVGTCIHVNYLLVVQQEMRNDNKLGKEIQKNKQMVSRHLLHFVFLLFLLFFSFLLSPPRVKLKDEHNSKVNNSRQLCLTQTC